nr:MAG TPA: hypothetical protein [Caudoviricetes sp.]
MLTGLGPDGDRVGRDAGHNRGLGLGMSGVWGPGPVGRVGSREGA